MINYESQKRSAVLNVDFLWPVGREYRIVTPTPQEEADPFAPIRELCIVQDGPEQFVQQPLRNGRLYLQFADLLKAPNFEDACLEFARLFGLPTQHAGDGAKERLSRWRTLAEQMRDSIEGLQRAIEEKMLPPLGASITEMHVMLVPGMDGRPTLALQPDRLWDALRLQLGQSIAGGRTIHACENSGCEKLFETGGGRGTGAKRLNAKFCSDECRKDSSKRNVAHKRAAQ